MHEKETCYIISNTHWDREWYQSHEKYLVRLVELGDRLFKLLEEDPTYSFVADGQFAMLEDYLHVRPEMRTLAEKFVKNGQLLVGPWYTQPLENIVGGEALIRNLQYGIRAADKLGGAMRFSYEVDEFGHTSQLPQILNGFGIHDVMGWRGVPLNSKTLFRWEAPDGTTVNFYTIPHGYGNAKDLPAIEEDHIEIIDGTEFHRPGLKTKVEDLRRTRREFAEVPVGLWLNGVDHSWAQENLHEVMAKIEALYPDLTLVHGTPAQYADAMQNAYREAGLTPATAVGELLYTEEAVLESANALHPRQKQRHYETENMLVHQMEPLTVAAWLLGRKYPGWAVDRAWQYVLENHAHDSLDCCSVDEVFEQVMARYGAAASLSDQVTEDSLRYIMSRGPESPQLYLFNSSAHSWSGTGIFNLQIPAGFGDENFRLVTGDGQVIPMYILDAVHTDDVRYNPRIGHPAYSKRTQVTAMLELPEIPAMGYRRFRFESIPRNGLVNNRRYFYGAREPGVMENEFLRVEIQPDGTFDLLEKTSGRRYPGQLRFEDCGEAGDVYIHAPARYDDRVIYSSGASVTKLFDTPLGTAYELKQTMEIPDGISQDRKYRADRTGTVTVTTKLTLLKGSKHLGISITVDNPCRNHRLRVLFPSYLRDAVCSEGGQAFDSVKRPITQLPNPRLTYEQPYATHPMQDYGRVTDGVNSLAVAARGIYEYECIDDDTHALALTLLRANDVISTGEFAGCPEYIMHEAQNLTTLHYELALIPDVTELVALQKQVDSVLRQPLARMNRQVEESLMPGYQRPEEILGEQGSLVSLDGEGLVITSVKKALDQDYLIVRILNTLDTQQTGCITLHYPGAEQAVIHTATLEERLQSILAAGNRAQFSLAPHKLLTLAVTAPGK